MEKLLLSLSAETPKSILYKILDMRKKANRGENVFVPLITLHLINGKEISGWIIDISNRNSVLIQLIGRDGRPSYDVLYIDETSVLAVAVHNAVSAAQSLCEKIPDEIPTKLELKRKTREYENKICSEFDVKITLEILWDTIPGASYSLLNNLLNYSNNIFKELSGEELSKNIIKSSVEKILFCHGEKNEVILNDKILSIIADFSDKRKETFTENSLKDKIEKVF